jgi:hypothetical protein
VTIEYPQYLHYVLGGSVLFVGFWFLDRVNGAPLKLWTIPYVGAFLLIASWFFKLGGPQ